MTPAALRSLRDGAIWHARTSVTPFTRRRYVREARRENWRLVALLRRERALQREYALGSAAMRGAR